MRLIDADKLPIYSTIEGIEKSKKGTVAILGNWVSAISIEEAPTVKAIPIDWIKQWQNENEWEYESFFRMKDGKPKYAIECMLEDWEKENEESEN